MRLSSGQPGPMHVRYLAPVLPTSHCTENLAGFKMWKWHAKPRCATNGPLFESIFADLVLPLPELPLPDSLVRFCPLLSSLELAPRPELVGDAKPRSAFESPWPVASTRRRAAVMNSWSFRDR